MPDTSFTWIDAAGNVTDLNDWVTTWATKGKKNFFAPPMQINSYEVPLTPGEAFSSVEVRPRQLDFPMLIAAQTHAEFISKMRTLVSAMNPDKGEGTLRVGHDGATARELKCRYVSGLEGSGSGKGWGPSSGLVIVSLRASDPFWYELVSVTSTYILGAPVTFFPFFPLRLSQSGIFTEPSVTNSGDHTAWPVWTITGPATSVIVHNLTTGFSLTVNLTVPAATTLTIDTRPGRKTIQMNGQNYFSAMSSDSVLWGLARGANNLQIILNDADGNSSVQLSYRPPFYSY